jgi:hypothetical protein
VAVIGGTEAGREDPGKDAAVLLMTDHVRLPTGRPIVGTVKQMHRTAGIDSFVQVISVPLVRAF